MKKLINIISVAAVLASLTACESGIDKIKIGIGSHPSDFAVDLTAPYVCDEYNAEETAFTATWQLADMGSNVSCSYYIEVDLKGNNFDSPVMISAGNNVTSRQVTSEQLSGALLRLGVESNSAQDLEMRVTAKPIILGTATPDVPEAVSPNTITINAMTLAPPTPIHVIGRFYTSSSSSFYPWSVSNYRFVMFRDDPLGVDMFITTFDNQQASFRFAEDVAIDLPASSTEPGGAYWDYAYGKPSDDSSDLSLRYANGDSKTNGTSNILDIRSMASGYYVITCNVKSLKYSIEPYDISSAPEYTSITMSGTALESPTPMNILSRSNGTEFYDPHLWFADGIDLEVGTLTFSSNTGKQWGGSEFPWGKSSDGQTTVEIRRAGKYFIRFSDLTGHYVFYIKKDDRK